MVALLHGRKKRVEVDVQDCRTARCHDPVHGL
jgi:hypothetical protein